MLMAEATLLGIAQDGGRPQPSCQMPCCKDVKHDEEAIRYKLAELVVDVEAKFRPAQRILQI